MIALHPDHLKRAKSAQTGAELAELLQGAMQLEHSTIPPYLTAGYSLKRNSNTEIFAILKEIAVEEMLHMSLVANIINAIGHRPNIAGEDFVPKYPGPLPMAIQTSLQVGIKKFSRDLVRDVFMAIEQPENPLLFPVMGAMVETEEYATIGQFYTAIINRIHELGDGIFTGDPARQVVLPDQGEPWDRLQPVTSAATAIAALRWIVEDGEGTASLPFDGGGQLAHYYRFSEIYHGKRIIQTDQSELGFAYGGEPIVIDDTQIWDLPDNPKVADYPEGSDQREAAERFSQMYSDMLRSLQRAFDGEPEHIMDSLQWMGRLRQLAVRVVQLIDPATGKSVGLTYEYRPPLAPAGPA